MTGSDGYVISYRINNNKRTPEENTRTVHVPATRAEIDAFVASGYMVRRGWFPDDVLARMRDALDRLERHERELPDGEYREGNGFFVRGLQDKDPVFRDLIAFEPPLAIARAVLGPQVAVEADARIAYEGQAEKLVPWHIHRRVVPDPLPPLFSYPHGVHCLVYLDDVGPREGPLVVLPGSHLRHDVELPYHGSPDVEGQEVVEPRAGDAVLIHSNLWHRTSPTDDDCARRRLLIVGYDPAWLNTEVPGSAAAQERLTDDLRHDPSPAVREIVGGFHW